MPLSLLRGKNSGFQNLSGSEIISMLEIMYVCEYWWGTQAQQIRHMKWVMMLLLLCWQPCASSWGFLCDYMCPYICLHIVMPIQQNVKLHNADQLGFHDPSVDLNWWMLRLIYRQSEPLRGNTRASNDKRCKPSRGWVKIKSDAISPWWALPLALWFCSPSCLSGSAGRWLVLWPL